MNISKLKHDQDIVAWITIFILGFWIGTVVNVTFIDNKSLVTFFSVLAVMVGWFVNGVLNRRHELFKRRMDLRIEMYESCLVAAVALEKLQLNEHQTDDPYLSLDFAVTIEQCQSSVLMYGKKDEIDHLLVIVQHAQSALKDGDLKNDKHPMKTEMENFMGDIRTTLRKDLNLSELL